MHGRSAVIAALISSVLLATAVAVRIADAASGAESASGWQFEITPYLWLPETHGTITVRDRSADLDVGLGEVFDLLGAGDLFGGMGHVEARKGKLALFTDAMGVVINDDAHGKILRDRVDVDVEADFDMAMVELGAAYRLLERGRFVLEGVAGARYTYAYTGVEVQVGEGDRSRDGSQNFVDPFFGIRGEIRLADQWAFVVRSDVGGFGAGSQLAWTALGGFRWDIPRKLGSAQPSLFAGYKVYDVDYENGAGGSKREIDVQLRGPALGVTFTF